MTSHTAFVICSAMTAIATGRIKFSFNFVKGYVVAAMLKFTIRPVSITDGWLHFNFIGVAVITEGTFVTGGAETVIRSSVETVIFYERRGVTE